MAFKVVAFVSLLSFSCIASGEEQYERVEYSPIEFFKNYALSACIARGYSSKEVIDDATASARGYLELGDHPVEAYNEVVILGKEFLKKEYKSHLSDERLILMKCIDFYHSKELDKLARKYCSNK
ncbi:MAG: type VI secretion system amidase immunity protein Tai4 [Betaproteobacteria bacterium]|jgi:hypothetical protein|nr:type VI secretion system amidase immunity protein Tai4 [Betaproteobacteria bacterium]